MKLEPLQGYVSQEVLEELFRNTSMVSVKMLSTEGMKNYAEDETQEVLRWLEDFEDWEQGPEEGLSEVLPFRAKLTRKMGTPKVGLCDYQAKLPPF